MPPIARSAPLDDALIRKVAAAARSRASVSAPCAAAATPEISPDWPTGRVVTDAAGAILRVDPAARRLLSRLGVRADDIFSNLAAFAPDLRAAAERGTAGEICFDRRIGPRGAETRLVLLRGHDGSLHARLADASAEARADRAERLSRATVDALREVAPDAVVRMLAPSGEALDGRGGADAFAELLGDAAAQLDLDRLLADVRRCGEARVEMARQGDGGRRRRLALTLRALAAPGEPIDGFLLIARELTARGEREAELRRLAQTDPLTGLLNRRAFFAAARGSLLGGPPSIIAIDLDDLKRLNDEGGHAAGDRALQALAEVARANTRAGDLVARLGGDEFAIALAGADAARAAAVAERLRAALAQGGAGAGLGPLSASFGVVTPRPGESFESALLRADAALYRAKLGGRNRIQVEAA